MGVSDLGSRMPSEHGLSFSDPLTVGEVISTNIRFARISSLQRLYSVVVITLDFESKNRGSNPCRDYLFFFFGRKFGGRRYDSHFPSLR